MNHWKKGALHTHTLWSDGRSIPELAIKTYRQEGYHFVCLSDHNLFQDDPNFWMPVMGQERDWPPELAWKEYNRTFQYLKPEELDIKYIGYRTLVRMKTFVELKEAFEEPGEFLLIPGEEMTTGQKNPEHNFRYDCHLNIFNLDQYLPPYTAEADDSTIVKNCYQIYREAADKSPRHSFIMLNHPFWRFWDVDPCVLLDTPEIRFFEVCNNDVDDKSIDNPLMTVEKFWDFVLAHRIDRKQPLLYATATDDTHYYDEERYHVNGSYAMGWVMVNCPGEFTADAITDAMLKGDFYPTSGVLLESIEFSADSKTLQVKVKEEDGVNYRIEFITTRKDFDRTIVKKLHKFNDTYTRYLTIIPDNIGQSVKTVEGSSASYTMNDDELYVRAIIYSDKPGRIEQNTFYPAFEQAWTQPFLNPQA